MMAGTPALPTRTAMPTPGQKATATRKRRRAGAKAAITRRRRAAGRKAAALRKRRAAARKTAGPDYARTALRDVMASPALPPKVFGGGYSLWGEALDTGTLEATLRAVGEFGGRYWAMRLPDGRFPAPAFQPNAMAEDRMVYALESFAILRGTGRYEFKKALHWNEEFSQLRPRFRESTAITSLVIPAPRGLAISTSAASFG